MASPKMSVLLTTEGTYPFSQGGVSTWCDSLVQRLGTVDYTVIAILTDPFVTQKFTLPKSTKLIRLPLWGTDDPSEHLDVQFSSIYLAKQRTTATVVTEKFLNIFDDFVHEILTERKDSEKMGFILARLYDFFHEFDYKVAFKSPLVWDRYKALVQVEVERPGSGFDGPDIYGMIQSLGWLYRFFNIVNTRVPETTVCHSSAAAFCGIPCVIAKLKYGTPFLLTEHGVYLREQYLSLSKRGYSSFLNTFLVRMIRSITDLNFHFADQISPVCEYNTRWERRMTDRHERIKVIYNGVDHRSFVRVEPKERKRPTVVTLARIDPIKDLKTLIRAAEKVREQIPNVHFLIYGSITVPEYHEECVSLIRDLSLQNTVEIAGHTSDIVAAYDRGDIVVQSSISEAFPYAVIEAMFAGKPVVSTGVGGIPEAIGDTGLLVYPGDFAELANAVVKLLLDKEARIELGQEARRRALDLFTLDRSLQTYMRTYVRLAVMERRLYQPGQLRRHQLRIARPVPDVNTASVKSAKARQTAPRHDLVAERVARLSPPRRRQLAVERALALLENGYPVSAAHQLKQSIRTKTAGPSDVVKGAILASIYDKLGMVAEADQTRGELHSLNRRALNKWQQLLAERAYASADLALYPEAVKLMKSAIHVNPNSIATPIFLLDMSGWLEHQGEYGLAEELRLKSDLIASIMARTS